MNIHVKRLTVKYHDKIVGYLKALPQDKIAFQYHEDWVKNGFSISPFSLPLTDRVFISNSEHFQGLFGVFHDALPDGWGELLVRRMLAKKGLNYDKVSTLTRLSLIQKNGLGALVFEPTQSERSKDEFVDLDTLAQEIKLLLNHDTENYDFDVIYALGGSSGGARPKAHVVINDEAWIVKFPSSLDPQDSGKREYLANTLAKKAHIHVNGFALFPSMKSSGYFGAKRFDIVNQKSVHVVSLSSLLETTFRIPNLDYVHYFQVIQKICSDQSDLYEAYKRMCFNVLYQNKDDHGKNFAFLYDETRNGYTLSPFYDITQTKEKSEHEMTVLGFGNPTEEHLIEIADMFHMSKKTCQEIILHIKRVIK